MQLSINAELRPVIDGGILRTSVQLLDTNVVMENGAFPPSWSLFVQDLVRGDLLPNNELLICFFPFSPKFEMVLFLQNIFSCDF